MFYRIIFLTFILYTNASKSQTFIVDYNLILGNFTKIDSINTRIKDIDNELKLNFNNIIQNTLIHSQQQSIFKSYKDVKVFSNPSEKTELDFLNYYKLNDFTSIIFKDFKLKKTKNREFIIDKAFVISDTLKSYNWILNNKEKKVKGFNCFSAETIDLFGNKVLVWFTSDVPASNGPGDFHGLPGLIIQVETDSYTFEITSLKLINKNIEFFFEEKGTIVNMEEFLKIYQENTR